MKIKEWVKNLSSTPYKKNIPVEYTAHLNEQPIENIEIKSFGTHHETYELLRSFKTIQYETMYVFRNKRGYNTYLFNINFDIVVCDKYGKVLEAISNIKPGTISQHYSKGYYVFFMPVGTIVYLEIKKLDVISIARKWLR